MKTVKNCKTVNLELEHFTTIVLVNCLNCPDEET